MPEEDTVASLFAALDAEQERLHALLAGRDEAKLAERPPNGSWSVVENVRHLLFAEQAHLRPFAPKGQEMSPFGLAHDGLLAKPSLRMVGSATPDNVGEVLDAWQAIHASIRSGTPADTDEARTRLRNHIKHLRGHIQIIERGIRRTGA